MCVKKDGVIKMNDKSIWKLLLKQSPPVMLALLIQSVYNIVDSFFVAKYSEAGLTALSIIFPVQLLMTALATGTGVGANILISKTDGSGDTQQQPNYVKANLFLETIDYIFYAGIGMVLLRPFYEFSLTNPDVRTLGYQYGSIILIGSFGFFIESGCTKILQAKGNMVMPMVAQIIGAIANIILDPILIFGCGKLPGLGIYGAAIATIVGQWVAMLITFLALCKTMNGKISAGNCVAIYRMGFPSILMQSLYTLYIIGLNLILKQFTEDAVTVLGIYYKLQTFFFIPLMGLQQVIVPIVSFFHGAGNWKSAKKTLFCSVCISSVVMLVSTVVFLTVPKQLITIFSPNPSIMDI